MNQVGLSQINTGGDEISGQLARQQVEGKDLVTQRLWQGVKRSLDLPQRVGEAIIGYSNDPPQMRRCFQQQQQQRWLQALAELLCQQQGLSSCLGNSWLQFSLQLLAAGVKL